MQYENMLLQIRHALKWMIIDKHVALGYFPSIIHVLDWSHVIKTFRASPYWQKPINYQQSTQNI